MTMDWIVLVRDHEDRFREYQRRLDEHRLELRRGPVDARELRHKIIEELEDRLTRVRDSLDRFDRSKSENWRELLHDTEQAWQDVTDSFEKAATEFRKHETEEEAGR